MPEPQLRAFLAHLSADITVIEVLLARFLAGWAAGERMTAQQTDQ